MPNWKKVVVSGSAASLSSVTISGNISGSATSTGSFAYINASSKISGSSTSTGSFGRVEATNIDATNFSGDGSSLTGITDPSGIAFAIVFGG